MAIYTTVSLYQDPAELFKDVAFINYQAALAFIFGATVEWSVTVFRESPAIQLDQTFSGGGDTQRNIYVLWSVDDTIGAPPAFLLDSAGMSVSLTSSGSAFWVDNLADIQEALEAYVTDALIPFVQGVTAIELTVTLAQLSANLEEGYGTVGIQLAGTDENGRVWMPALGWAGYQIITDEEDPLMTIQNVGTLPIQKGVTNVVADSAAMARIADALEVISLMDVEVSINHGQAMYSVTGKVTTG